MTSARVAPQATRLSQAKAAIQKDVPRGVGNVGAMLREVIRQKIPVTKNGKTRRIPALEVMLRRLANDAMRNDPKALKLLLSLVDRYADSPETECRLDELLAEDRAILAQYLGKPSGLVADPAEHSDG